MSSGLKGQAQRIAGEYKGLRYEGWIQETANGAFAMVNDVSFWENDQQKRVGHESRHGYKDREQAAAAVLARAAQFIDKIAT